MINNNDEYLHNGKNHNNEYDDCLHKSGSHKYDDVETLQTVRVAMMRMRTSIQVPQLT